MKNTLLILIILAITAMATAVEIPTVHSTIMLDTYFMGGQNAGNDQYDYSSRFQIRKAALNFTGTLNKKTTYAIEMAVSTCTGPGDTFRLAEAEIVYNFAEFLQAGIKQGHIMRGFCFYTECSQRLTMEKPWFQKTFAACHPLGLTGQGYFNLPWQSGLQYQVAVLNGLNGTFEDEHDILAALMYDTPLMGLAASASFSHTAARYYDQAYQSFYDDGYRWGIGAQYRNYNVWATSEYYYGKGFTDASQEMAACYAQAGYGFELPFKWLQKIQPWIKYEIWDKNSNNSKAGEFVYFDTGVNFHLSSQTMIKAAYSELLDKPDSELQTPHSLTIRLQTDF